MMKGGLLRSWFCIIISAICYTVSSANGGLKSITESDTIHRESAVKGELVYLELKRGYYSVIGVFDQQVNAIRLVEEATAKGITAKYGYVSEVRRFYVYTFHTEDFEAVKAIKNMLKTGSDHKDAWVLRYSMEKNALPTIVSSNVPVSKSSKNSSNPTNTTYASSSNGSATENQADPTPATSNSAVPTPVVAESLYKSYHLLVKVSSEASGKALEGQVKLINTEKAKLLANVNANEPITLNLPKAENPNVEFVCDVFGFQKMSMHVNLESLKASDSIGDHLSKYSDTLLVNLKMKPYKTGDVIVLYNVYFYDNSSIIRPVSKSQLNTVYEMLAENKKMQVNIHGHTNGDDHGEIIKMDEGDTTFFQVTPKNIRTQGSAYSLSSERALTIKRWLIYRGIDAKRLDTKAWGGKKKLYDHPLDFGKNIRVELEIVKDSK